MFKCLIVGGKFGDTAEECRPSGYIQKLAEAIKVMNPQTELCNGASFSLLETLVDEIADDAVVLWMPDVANDKRKLVDDIKRKHPKVILVTSKNNMNGKYSFMELVARALQVKANMFVEFTKRIPQGWGEGVIMASVCDPLGNVFCVSERINDVAVALVVRLNELCGFTRVKSVGYKDAFTMPEETEDIKEFLKLVRGYAEVFHEQIHPHNSSRLLGNVSFRCEHGFPSFKDGSGRIFVSRRNVDKRDIALDAFVPVTLISNSIDAPSISYLGNHKPSVDAPIHVMLYNYYQEMRYAIHSHTYVRKDCFTDRPIPCGAIEEFYEIIRRYPHRDRTLIVVNLVGHGSLVMAKDVSSLVGIEYVSRHVPERIMT